MSAPVAEESIAHIARNIRRVVPVNTSVRGRARLLVHGLLRNARVKSFLETELSGINGIRSVSANVATGNILVLYEGLSLEAVIFDIELTLDRARLPRPQDYQAAPKQTQRERAATKESDFSLRSLFHRRSDAETVTTLPRAEVLPAAAPKPEFAWHAKSALEVVKALGTSIVDGLSGSEARVRLEREGPNLLPEPQRRSTLSIFASQLKSLPVLLLFGSAVLSVATGGVADAAVILLVVGMNATIGCVTEVQAEKTIARLTKVREPRARVIRDGEQRSIEASEVTIGDLLVLTPGAYISADARLVEADNLTVTESVLTGESMSVSKTTDILPADVSALADRINMVYRGTAVTGGSGLAVVVAIGASTEMGRIQTLIATALRPQTPIERQLEGLGRNMVWISCALCGLVFVIGLARGLGFLQMLRTAVSLAVAAVPEGLPTVATTTLAFGLWRLRRHNIVARHLDAIETLGSIQVICLDKTGTITLNRMTVMEVVAEGKPLRFRGEDAIAAEDAVRDTDFARFVEVAALCNDAEILHEGGEIEVRGSGTESALLQLALDAGVDVEDLRERSPRIKIEHRTEQQQLMATWHLKSDGEWLLAAKGNPVQLLRHCSSYMSGGKPKPLTPKQRSRIEAENERMAAQALRVLGFAWREGEGETSAVNGDLTWLGLAGIADPPREGMHELMKNFHRAGIATRMITGDQRVTAYAIGKELGLSRNGRELQVVDAGALSGPNGEPNTSLPDAHVFARVNPSHKLQIVRAMQTRGEVVAMTGDGVNDGPALKAADIGVALGRAGTETAREVADLVLLDDDLQSLLTAVREGRAIYDDIQKSVHYITATNMSEILTTVGVVAAGLGQPLTPKQLLWINVLSDVLPCLALAVEPPHSDVMQRLPRDPQTALVTGRDYARLARQGSVMTAAGIGAYLFGLGRYGAGQQASTMAFLSLTLAQLLHAFSARSDQPVIGNHNLPSNRYLPLAIGGSLALELVAMLFPPLRGLLGLAPIGLVDGLFCVAAGAASLLINEALKSSETSKPAALPIPAVPLLSEPKAA